MSAIYNEIDSFAASWLRNLITAGHIAPGVVDERSIEDLTPADVAGPGQRHFFAGIGGWSYALRLAGIHDDADIWTGSCPCQPFSSAGKRSGTRDPRHLWPTWFELIRECRPSAVFGEQVASRDGLAWLDIVRADLERCGYAVGASDLCAAGVGAPHIRQRLYFVAYADEGGVGKRVHVQPRRSQQQVPDTERHSQTRQRGGQPLKLGDSNSLSSGRQRFSIPGAQAPDSCVRGRSHRSGAASEDLGQERMADGGSDGWEGSEQAGAAARDSVRSGGMADANRIVGGQGREVGTGSCARGDAESRPRPGGDGLAHWSDAIWIDCADGKRRPVPVEPALFPLAHGVPNRVGLLRGSGNAIVPQVAAAFVRASFDAITEQVT